MLVFLTVYFNDVVDSTARFLGRFVDKFDSVEINFLVTFLTSFFSLIKLVLIVVQFDVWVSVRATTV